MGARWVRKQILERYPSSSVRVFAVWFSMFPGDARTKWRDRFFDPRVINLWDEQKIMGRQLASYLRREESQQLDVVWDAFFLYGSDAFWDKTPPPLVSWGSPVIRASRRLRKDVGNLL